MGNRTEQMSQEGRNNPSKFLAVDKACKKLYSSLLQPLCKKHLIALGSLASEETLISESMYYNLVYSLHSEVQQSILSSNIVHHPYQSVQSVYCVCMCVCVCARTHVHLLHSYAFV